MATHLALPVPTEKLLRSMQEDEMPSGYRPGRVERQLLRETYFDTSDFLLHGRGMTLRMRLRDEGPRLVLFDVREAGDETLGTYTALETPAESSGIYETLCADSELAVRVREVVEPSALRPRVALDIDRAVRRARPGLLSRSELAYCYDAVSVQIAGIAQQFYQVSVERLRSGGADLAEIARVLTERYGLEPDGLDTLRRGLNVLRQVRTQMATQGGPAGRVAVIALRGTDIALVPCRDGLTLPTTERVRGQRPPAVAARVLGAEPGAVEPMGAAPERRRGKPLEVWLVRDPPESDAELTWFPVHELMEQAGAPGLRDPALIPGLLLLSRSPRFLELEPPERSDEARPAAPVSSGASRSADSAAPDPQHLLNPDLSELAFHARVLSLAGDPSVPLLERARFLSIFSSNLDEFFGVRVAGVKRRASRDKASVGEDGLLPQELLDLIGIRVRALHVRQYRLLVDQLLPALEREGIRVPDWERLTDTQRDELGDYFDREVFPLLTPRAMTMAPGHPFPHVSSQGLSLAAVLSREGQRDHLAHIRVPDSLPRFVSVPGTSDLIPLEAVIIANSESLFPGYDVSAHMFRVIRSGEYELEEEETESLIDAMEEVVRRRPYRGVVRIEVQRSMPSRVRRMLLRELRAEGDTEAGMLAESDIYEVDGPLDLEGLAELAELAETDEPDEPDEPDESDAPAVLPGESLRYPPFHGADPLPECETVFDLLKRQDVLVHHPYDDFEHSVGRLLHEAAEDPDVISIKLTLYRTGTTSPVVDALMKACKREKDVTVFVELKARWDEERNIEWTRRLTEAGVHVVYGVVDYKTHAKTALVVRREADGVRRYVHIGTGNYNAFTARFYTDVGLLSASPELGADLGDLFNELTGTSQPPMKQYRKIMVAPHTLLAPMLMRIEREIEHAQAGRPARIQAKMNGLDDSEIVHALYRASQAGVEVDLVVRGRCTLRPGVPGLSDRIRVISILGRFLEHARIFYFENDGAPEYFLGSADLRSRNLRRRIEVVAPVDAPELHAELREILDVQLADPRAWELRADGVYEWRSGADGVPSAATPGASMPPTSQERFMARAMGAAPAGTEQTV